MAAVDAPTTIIDPNATFTEKPVEDRTLSVGTAVCTGEVLDRIREGGGIMEATTPGLFMMPEGDKTYTTFLDMLRDQPMPPDPVFKDDDVLPIMEDKGVPLGKLDEMDIEFKKMYEEMFSRTGELGVMGAGDFEARLRERQNELSKSNVENTNGGSPGNLSHGESALYPPQCPSTPLHFVMQIPVAGDVVPLPEEGSYATDTKDHDGDAGPTMDA